VARRSGPAGRTRRCRRHGPGRRSRPPASSPNWTPRASASSPTPSAARTRPVWRVLSGASLGTAPAGSVLIASLTATLLAGVQQNPAVPPEVTPEGGREAVQRRPISLRRRPRVRARQGRRYRRDGRGDRLRALRVALAVIAIVAAAALFFSERIPTRQPASEAADPEHGSPDLDGPCRDDVPGWSPCAFIRLVPERCGSLLSPCAA
jgi:hypothetical protein